MRQTIQQHPTHHAQRMLEDKVAIVTGASRGIGAATAAAFAGAGAAVVLTARSENDLTTLAEQITREGGQALAVKSDVADPEGMRLVVGRALDAYEIRGGIAAGLPLSRLGGPDEVAATVTWLCSDEASFISGTTITIDGGKLAGGA